MKICLSFILLFPSFTLFANEDHVHGNIHLEINMEGTAGKMKVFGPIKSFMSFEKKPVTKNEINEFKQFKKHISTMKDKVTFPKGSGCKLNYTHTVLNNGEPIINMKHIDLEADFAIQCQKPPFGEINFTLQGFFQNAKHLEIQYFSETYQTGVDQSELDTKLKVK